MPQGFKQYDKQGRPKDLKLNRTLYGLRQSPHAFWLYLINKLEQCGLKQSKLDPCLFIGTRVICVVYVDDLPLWSPKEEYIYKLGELLCAEDVELEEEGDAAGSLGVQLHRKEATGPIHMTQEGLIKQVIEALGLDMDQTNAKGTPAEQKPQVKDKKGETQQIPSTKLALWKYYCTFQNIPDPILPTASAKLLILCSTPSIRMRLHSRELVATSLGHRTKG